MAWLRIDDGMPEHHKILSLPRKDRWTWIELLCYVARQNNGGHVPQGVCDLLRWVTPAFVKRCVELELLDLEDDGYHVHDWDVYNPPRVDADDLDERVAETLERFPDASANEVARILGGRKKDVLDAVRRFRDGSQTVPERFPPSVPGTTREPVPRAGRRARAPSPAPQGQGEVSTSPPAPGDGDTAPSRGATPPPSQQKRDTDQRRAAAIADADQVAHHWNGGSPEAFADKLDAIAREHRTTIGHLERDRLWHIAFDDPEPALPITTPEETE